MDDASDPGWARPSARRRSASSCASSGISG